MEQLLSLGSEHITVHDSPLHNVISYISIYWKEYVVLTRFFIMIYTGCTEEGARGSLNPICNNRFTDDSAV